MLGKLGRRRIPTLVGEARVPGDVEEAHRRRPVDPLLQTRPLERGPHRGHDVARPDMPLLGAVDRQQGVDRQEAEPWGDLGRPPAEILLGQAAGKHRIGDLAAPPLALGFGNSPQALAVDAQAALDRERTEAEADLVLDERNDRELVLAHEVIGGRPGSAEGLPHGQQQVHRDASFAGSPGQRSRRSAARTPCTSPHPRTRG